MTKNNYKIVLVICALGAAVGASATDVPEPFQGFDNDSLLTIDYDNLSELYRIVVVDVGTSNRAISLPAPEITGTRMKPKVKKLTSKEGNRFFYEAFQDNDAGQQYLLTIQQNLEALPTESPLELFSRDEQLAYWLNLYNVTLLNEIIAVYPKRSLRRLLTGRKSVLTQKLLTVSGVSLSLDDIQYTILAQNYDSDPLIIYGFYQGIVGGPDIRPIAYNGDDVYRALENNAFLFINSNRGTYIRDEDIFRVSSLYDRNSMYFPEFDADLSKHLLVYLEGDERDALQSTKKIKTDINDWTVTDLGGTRHQVGGSFLHSNAALINAYRANEASVYGGVLTAPVEIKRKSTDPDDRLDDREDLDRISGLGTSSVPVDGANVEEVDPEE